MTRSERRKGFTLIEMAFAVMILGLVVAAAVNLYSRSQDQKKLDVTRQNMRAIVSALSTYAETADRIPCPANPTVTDASFGWEWGVTTAVLKISNYTNPIHPMPTASPPCSVTAGNVTGIVPYQTLGIPYETILDGWGHYFTYAVSPVFSQNTDRSTDASGNIQNATTEVADTTHAFCRTASWVDTGGNPGATGGDNFNSPKARFCCAANPGGSTTAIPTSSSLIIKQATGATSTQIAPSGLNNSTNYASVVNILRSTTYPAALPDDYPYPFNPQNMNEVVAPAFVLVSHGRFGYGAFKGNGTATPIRIPAVGASTNETENSNGDQTYVTGPRVLTPGTSRFDNIVVWMTQFGVMAANGTSSCALP